MQFDIDDLINTFNLNCAFNQSFVSNGKFDSEKYKEYKNHIHNQAIFKTVCTILQKYRLIDPEFVEYLWSDKPVSWDTKAEQSVTGCKDFQETEIDRVVGFTGSTRREYFCRYIIRKFGIYTETCDVNITQCILGYNNHINQSKEKHKKDKLVKIDWECDIVDIISSLIQEDIETDIMDIYDTYHKFKSRINK